MPDEELTLILRLRDEATKQMKSARAGIVAAGAAIAAAGFTAGKKWDTATKTIVAGTGATGKALKGLQKDYQAVAKYGDNAATVIADLNTHLGLEGKALQDVAEAALKAKVDTNLFGDVAAQLGLDAQGATAFLDDLTVASQGTGVDIDMMTRTIGRSSARWLAAGGDMDGLTATVIKAADEFGPSGLRGAMSEILQEVDKGLIPSFESLDSQLGDTTGAVERTYKEGKTWRDTLREMKDGALAYLGPGGDMVGAIGSAASGLALAGPQMIQWIKGLKGATLAQKALNIMMSLNLIGLVVTAIGGAVAAYIYWKDEINAFLKGAWNNFMVGIQKGIDFLRPLASKLGIDLPTSMDKYTFAVDEGTVQTQTFAEAVGGAGGGGSPSLVTTLQAANEEIKLLTNKGGPYTRTFDLASQTTDRWGRSLQSVTTSMGVTNQLLPNFAGGLLGLATVGPPAIMASGVATGEAFGDTFMTRMSNVMSPANISTLFTSAFTGGGGVLGALKGIGSQLAGVLTQSLLGPLSSALSSGIKSIFVGGAGAAAGAAGGAAAGGAGVAAGAAGGGLGGLIGVVGAIPGWGWAAAGVAAGAFFIAKFFGKPNKMEKAGRAAAAAARDAIADTLTDGQIKEAAGDAAASVHIAVRDASLAAGKSLADAEVAASHWVAALHRAEKEGGGAVDSIKRSILDLIKPQEDVVDGTKDITAAMIKSEQEMKDNHAQTMAEMAQATKASVATQISYYGQLAGAAVGGHARGGESSYNKYDAGFGHLTDAEDFLRRNPGDDHRVAAALASQGPGRQHGGPVRAGRPYMVGERGPEMFVPGRSGGIVPNSGIPSAEEIGAAVAAALRRSPLVVPQDPVTDALYRNGPRRAALHGY